MQLLKGLHGLFQKIESSNTSLTNTSSHLEILVKNAVFSSTRELPACDKRVAFSMWVIKLLDTGGRCEKRDKWQLQAGMLGGAALQA
eukprot:scaffold273074_cov14-Tisochrysis_lutea.AAC.1